MAKRRSLNEYRVELTRVKRGERAVPLDYPENLGLRTKLGGKPDWIQSDETPDCEECGEPSELTLIPANQDGSGGKEDEHRHERRA